MKRYLLFISEQYYPSIGMYDCKLRTSDYEEMMRSVYKYCEFEKQRPYEEYKIQYYDVEIDDYFDWSKEKQKWVMKEEYFNC